MMSSDKQKEYEKFLKQKFDIILDEKNKKYFFGVMDANNSNDSIYSSKVLAFKGDPLISFIVCDKYTKNVVLTEDRKLTNFEKRKEDNISDKLFIKIFNSHNFENFIDYNSSNEIGKKVKSSCIEAFIYAVYKCFGVKKSRYVFNQMIHESDLKKHML